MRAPCLALALLSVPAGAWAQETADAPAVVDEVRTPAEGTIDTLPDGTVRTVLERLPDRQADLLVSAARSELAPELARLKAGTISALDFGRAAEQILGFRAALLAAGSDPAPAAQLAPALAGVDQSELVTAAYASDALGSRIGDLVGRENSLALAREILAHTQYLYRPARPCSEPTGSVTNRLTRCVDRAAFRGAVGIGWQTQSGVEVDCSGQLLDSRTVVTADHCVPSDDVATMVVLTHYTGGTGQARRRNGGTTYTGVSLHRVAQAHRAPDVERVPGQLRQYDIAILELADPVAVERFPSAGPAFPQPLRLTVAGWGWTDAPPVGGVGLEVTIVSVDGPNRLSRTGETLVSWSAALSMLGSGICQGDSGGPVFAGEPDAQGRMELRLIGLVAGGNRDCRSGAQFVTDLTSAAGLNRLCTLAPATAFCRNRRRG